MKLSKIASWLVQIIMGFIGKLTADVNTSIREVVAQVVGETNASVASVNTSILKLQAELQATVAQASAAMVADVNARTETFAGETRETLTQINAQLETLVAVETEDDFRKSLEQVLPKEILEQMKW